MTPARLHSVPLPLRITLHPHVVHTDRCSGAPISMMEQYRQPYHAFAVNAVTARAPATSVCSRASCWRQLRDPALRDVGQSRTGRRIGSEPDGSAASLVYMRSNNSVFSYTNVRTSTLVRPRTPQTPTESCVSTALTCQSYGRDCAGRLFAIIAEGPSNAHGGCETTRTPCQ